MTRASIGIALAVTCLPQMAAAQVVQSLHLGAGAFLLRRVDLRADGDVLAENRQTLSLEMRDLNSGRLFGEWLWTFGDRIEVAAGAGFSSGYARTSYDLYENAITGAPIEQDLRLRIVPISGLVRFIAGRPGDFQPYAGVGLSAQRYRYSESGEFIDFADFSTYRTTYVAAGTAVGPMYLFGLRAPVYGDVWALTFEWRYQYGVGDTGGLAKGFLTDRIDLGGHNINFGWLTRF